VVLLEQDRPRLLLALVEAVRLVVLITTTTSTQMLLVLLKML
jgi:hypothetical protein